MTELIIRPAQAQDADVISALVNRAYRGDSSRAGWTTEADLLEGKRTTTEEVLALLNRQDVVMLTGWVDKTLMVTLCAEWHAEAQVTHLGMIAVEPTAQNRGYGKQMILAAEQLAVARWGTRASQMAVVSVRQTLIAFYQRLGYEATGELKPFPHLPEMWQAKVENMQLMTLQKAL
jgi:ribosomal protein S18 acetylase RimI-like enzyme